MAKPLRALVAKVLDEEQIAINAGTEAGVNVGDRVYLLKETEIPDPEKQGQSLGTAFVRKGTLAVETVADKFAVARVTRVSKGMLGPSEPTFTISDDDVFGGRGRGRVVVAAGDPVDVVIREAGYSL